MPVVTKTSDELVDLRLVLVAHHTLYEFDQTRERHLVALDNLDDQIHIRERVGVITRRLHYQGGGSGTSFPIAYIVLDGDRPVGCARGTNARFVVLAVIVAANRFFVLSFVPCFVRKEYVTPVTVVVLDVVAPRGGDGSNGAPKPFVFPWPPYSYSRSLLLLFELWLVGERRTPPCRESTKTRTKFRHGQSLSLVLAQESVVSISHLVFFGSSSLCLSV